MNERVTGVVCIRCGSQFAVGESTWGDGCPTCLAEGFPASVDVAYAPAFVSTPVGRARMQDFARLLPYPDYITLGEGGTPLLTLDGAFIKYEGQNPSGSHKDRLSPLVVARARELNCRGVICASSGNQGASLALYAAAAGVPCAVITTLQINPIWARAISTTGAKLIMVDEPKQRWRLMQQMVTEEGWYPATNYLDPPVGSNPFGVQGYKTISFEIAQELGGAPNVVVVPCSRGDLLWGMWIGFQEAQALGWIASLPRMVAVEPFPRLVRVLDGEDYRGNFPGSTALSSIGGSTVTYQAVAAVRQSGGCALAVGEADAEEARDALGKAGFYAESSSAVVWAANQRLRNAGWIQPGERSVLVVTSNGYKES
ncbi:MAG TPA: pyridoxal-phosphate dependent enzyme [Symbiobacteriaceae bacterium]|nr:pyridoxal-phosphate dependent enzyme [Symbiobacteriaceae bacterium]